MPYTLCISTIAVEQVENADSEHGKWSTETEIQKQEEKFLLVLIVLLIQRVISTSDVKPDPGNLDFHLLAKFLCKKLQQHPHVYH